MNEDKVKKYAKYWHIFSWAILNACNAFGDKKELVEIYDISQAWAERDGHGGSWLDVFDGICWICAVVAFMIIVGFLMS